MVEVRSEGFWTADYAYAQPAQLDAALTGRRARFGLARVLVDLRQAAVQPPETGRVYRPEDRVAVSVDTPNLR